MPVYPTWPDILARLVVTMIAGTIIGFNRGARGEAAGLRTTILVGLAASVAMIQANILLPVTGKTSASFGIMDLMRLPLGILTGVGFIGAGAIFRRDDLVGGVTTAATLWVMTVIGLCFGGDQIALGIVATILAAFTLSAVRWVDMRIPREQRGMLVIREEPDSPGVLELPVAIAPLGYSARFHRQERDRGEAQANFSFEIFWTRPEIGGPPLDLLKKLRDEQYSVASFELMAEARH
jgi:putative Mg2+ transporter-C (MgtC) family protein